MGNPLSLRFISLFAGIGGFDLGLERAGMTCVAQVEIDPFCQKVLQKHWPDIPKYGDIRNVGKHNLPAADLICGGFPCQPHSTAGKRKGAADDRNLWPEYLRIIDELRPTWVVGENVLGIRTTILDQVLSDLESLDYSTVTLDLPAAGFNAPHIRERIFIIAHAKSRSGRISIPTREQEKELHPGGTSLIGNASNPHGTRLEKSARTEFGGVSEEIETSSRGAFGGGSSTENGRNWWEAKPGICGVADGVPNRVDRLRSLGNALVPQAAEFIGRHIQRIANDQSLHLP